MVVAFLDRLFSVLDHRLGPGDVSFEAKRFRHRAIAAHQIPVGNIVVAGYGRQIDRLLLQRNGQLATTTTDGARLPADWSGGTRACPNARLSRDAS